MKRALVLGGTRFFGKKLVELLIDSEYRVTILTRGNLENPFGDKVQHIVADRSDKEALRDAIGETHYDLVFDNICYSPNDAKALCEVLEGRVEKVVFTSTLSTYELDGKAKVEEDFNPYDYPIRYGDVTDFTYGEGKKLAEAVFFKEAAFPVVAVRFPIVMDEDDYTRRLHTYIEMVRENKPILLQNVNAEMSFILAEEATKFLKWVGENEVLGPYNATANGKISLLELIHLIERVTNQEARVEDQMIEATTPFDIPDSWYMKNDKAQKAGFQFSNLQDWLAPLIERIHYLRAI